MKKTKLFITGMSGTAGRALARLALAENFQVGGTIYQSIPTDLKALIDQDLLQVYQIDLRAKTEINQVIQNFQPDVVIHLAGKVLAGTDIRVSDPVIYEENILFFRNTIDAIKLLKKRPKFILSSGCLVYNKQISADQVTEVSIQDLQKIDISKQPYRASKVDQEKILSQEGKEGNLNYIIARPTQFTGPGKIRGVIEWYIATNILKIQAGETENISVRNKYSEVDILDARDVAKALLVLAKKGIYGEVYHISSGSPVTVEAVAKILLQISNMDPNKYPVISTDNETVVYFRFSPAKISSLGWKLSYSLEDALTSYWEYFNNQKQ